jgi:hypothetical protein
MSASGYLGASGFGLPFPNGQGGWTRVSADNAPPLSTPAGIYFEQGAKTKASAGSSDSGGIVLVVIGVLALAVIALSSGDK